MIAIETKSLCKQFKVPVKKPGLKGALEFFFKKKFKTVEAVKGISFQIEKGELVGFLGPNGAGKTTTLKLLSGLLYPTSGTLNVLGFVPWKRETRFQKKFSMVMGQRTQLWWDLPAVETFALNQKIYEIPQKDFEERKEEITELLEIEDLLDVPVKKLSLGERMKAELACAILHRPEVLLLDEPTLGLDIVMQKKLRHFILQYKERHAATILLTSHNMADVEELCKRVIVIDGGEILYDGDLEKIVQKYAPDKLVVLSSSRVLEARDLAKFGRIVSHNGTSAKLEVPRREVSAVIGKMLSEIPVVDLSIEELPIEEIIRRVFLKSPAPLSSATVSAFRDENPEEIKERPLVDERSVP
jgi:ABC-2 type transport system ATP-binding protein